jgi:WD40-like Beta Propeller Repeat
MTPNPPCDEYGLPELITGVPDGLDKPSFSPDGLTILFKAPGPDDFYTAVRNTSEDLAFGNINPIEVVSNFELSDSALSADGLSLYFAFGLPSEPNNTTLGKIVRADEMASWSSANGPIQTNSAYRETAPWERADGLELLFTSDRPSELGGENIWVASRAATSDDFGNVLLVTALSSASDDSASTLTGDGLTVYFTSNRPGGVGGSDLWTAERPSLGEPFQAATLVSNINSTADDSDPVPSQDGLELYFISDRNGVAQLWRSRRSCT